MCFKPNIMKRFSCFNALVSFSMIFIFFFIASCVASIPVVVKYIENDRQYTATLEVYKEASEIYKIVIREIDKLPDVKIIKKDDLKFSVEASRADRTTRIKALPQGTDKSRVTITADAGKSWDESKDLANRVVKKICEEVNMQCRLIVQ